MRYALAVVLLLGACKTVPPPEPKTDDKYNWRALNEAWEDPAPLPPFRFIDQDAKEFALSDFDDAYLVFGFVFSRCPMPKACPLTMKRMAAIQKLWAEKVANNQTKGRKLQLIGVTLDPEFDSPDILKAWGTAFGADWTNWKMVTGPEELVAKEFPLMFNVLALPVADEAVRIRHSVKVALVAPGRIFKKDWPNNEFEPKEVVDLILAD